MFTIFLSRSSGTCWRAHWYTCTDVSDEPCASKLHCVKPQRTASLPFIAIGKLALYIVTFVLVLPFQKLKWPFQEIINSDFKNKSSLEQSFVWWLLGSYFLKHSAPAAGCKPTLALQVTPDPSDEGSVLCQHHVLKRQLGQELCLHIACVLINTRGPGSSVGIATDYVLDGPGSNPGGDEIFRPSWPALGPTQPPIKWVPGLSQG